MRPRWVAPLEARHRPAVPMRTSPYSQPYLGEDRRDRTRSGYHARPLSPIDWNWTAPDGRNARCAPDRHRGHAQTRQSYPDKAGSWRWPTAERRQFPPKSSSCSTLRWAGGRRTCASRTGCWRKDVTLVIAQQMGRVGKRLHSSIGRARRWTKAGAGEGRAAALPYPAPPAKALTR